MSSAECEAEQAAQEQQAAPLPDELVELVVARVPRSAQPAARLVSKAFEAAVAVRAAQLREWPSDTSQPPHVRPSLQRHLQRVEVPGSRELTAADWRLLGELAWQLPALRWLRVSGDCRSSTAVPAPVTAAFSSLVRLDLPIDSSQLPGGVTLPALRVASFTSAAGLGRINALAPQLRQLQLRSLYLTGGSTAAGSLPHVTHYSGQSIYICDAGSTEAAGAALAAALPAVEVFVSLPSAGLSHGISLCLAELLAALPSLRAVRGWAVRLQLGDQSSQAELSRLQHLSLHEPRGFVRCTEAMCGWLSAAAPQLSSLQHVVLALRLQRLRVAPISGSCVLQLLRGLASLPALQSLVLPDCVLCSECCVSAGGGSEGLPAALATLACSPSLARLEFAEIDGCDCACEHSPQQHAAGRAAVSTAAAARAAPLSLRFGQRHEGGAGLHGAAFGELGSVLAAAVDEGSVWGELGPRAGQL